MDDTPIPSYDAEAGAERAAIMVEAASERAVVFSWGRDSFDAYPKQHTAASFAEFARFVCDRRAAQKGKSFFCSPFTKRDGRHHRSREDAAPRRFLPLDVDYIPDATTLCDLLLALQPYRHFAYTTASHTVALPRVRIVCELSRVVDRTEGMRIGLAFQTQLTSTPGLAGIKFDATVYRAEQPCFGPLTGAEIYPRDRRMSGAAIDVDELLAIAPEVAFESSTANRAEGIAHADPRIQHLYRHGYVLHAPMSIGKLAIRCPNAAAHSHETGPSATAVLLPHFNGVARPVVKCLHKSCASLTQEAFWDLAGYTNEGEPAQAVQNRVQRDANDRNGATPHDAAKNVSMANPAFTVDTARLPADWADVEQHPPPFIVERLLPESEAGSLVAPGSFGKSTLKLFESVHIILGRDLYGRRVLKPGLVLCVSKEDRGALIDYRLKQICRGMGLCDADMRRVQRNFLRLDLRGDAFMLQRVGADRIPFRSGDVTDLVTTFAGEGIALAWFDTASRFATGEGNQEASITIDACTVVADAFRCAAEVLHHVSQGIARTGTVDMHAGRGGTAFVDNSRFARQLLRHTGDALPGAISYRSPAGVDAKAETLLRLHTVKLTGARFDMHRPIWIERRDDWQFVYAEGDPGVTPSRDERQAVARSARAATDETAVLDHVRAQVERTPPRRVTQNDLIDTRERIVSGMSERRLRSAVANLRNNQRLVEVSIPGKVRGARAFLAPAGWQESIV